MPAAGRRAAAPPSVLDPECETAMGLAVKHHISLGNIDRHIGQDAERAMVSRVAAGIRRVPTAAVCVVQFITVNDA
jgi:hypothetical protein